MEQELLFRLMSVAGVVITSAIAIWNITLGRRKNFKEDYVFARDFLAEVEDDMHPFVRERGFQALAGTASVSASEVECLLALDPTGSSIGDYLLGRRYLNHVKIAESNRFQFKPKYKKKFARFARKVGLFLSYLVFSIAALSPLLFPLLSRQPLAGNVLLATAGSFAAFAPFAFIVVREAVKISRAEAVVERQTMQTPDWSSSRLRIVES